MKSSELQIFNELYTNYYSKFVRFANSYVRELPLAEDITSEAFMVYWENRDNIAQMSNPQAYILTIVKNKCLNYLTREEKKLKVLNNIKDNAVWELNVRISTLEACDPEELFSSEIQKIINETLASLPEKTLKVFTLSRYENKTYKEISEMMNITTKGVEFHMTKALSLFRKRLKDYIILLLYMIQ